MITHVNDSLRAAHLRRGAVVPAACVLLSDTSALTSSGLTLNKTAVIIIIILIIVKSMSLVS